MSGTSLDGVDVVLAAIDENMVAWQGSYCHSWVSLIPGWASYLLRRSNKLLRREALEPSDIVAIGCHGQTV